MSREIEMLFTDTICRFRQDTEGFVATEREKALWSNLPESGLRLEIDGDCWAVVRGETEGDYRIGEFRVIDQGVCLHDYEKSKLCKVIDYVMNDATEAPTRTGADPTASEDDFWFSARPSYNELMVCLGFPDRAYLQYMRGPNRFISFDSTFKGQGRPVEIWDPGMSTRVIPRANFITKESAIESIRQFFDCGFITIDRSWEQRS